MALGVVIANALLPITAGESVKDDVINAIAAIETSVNCASPGCIQTIIGATESMDLFNLSGSFVIGKPESPICELSSTGALQGRNCSISANVVIAGAMSMSTADARYIRKSGGTMTGALNILNGKGLQVAGTITGSTIKAASLLTSSGGLIFEGEGSGASLHISGLTALSGSLVVEGEPRLQRIISIPLCDTVTACAVGSGVTIRIPKMMNNYAFSGATLDAGVAGTTGTMSVQVINIDDGTNFFTTKITLDSAETSSDTAATPYVRNATLGQRTVTDGDRIMPRVDAVNTTPAKGVTINLHFIPL